MSSRFLKGGSCVNIKVLLGLKERGYRIKKSIGERVYTVRRQRGEATILEYDHAYLIAPKTGARRDILLMRCVKEDLRALTGMQVLDYYEYFGVRGG